MLFLFSVQQFRLWMVCVLKNKYLWNTTEPDEIFGDNECVIALQ